MSHKPPNDGASSVPKTGTEQRSNTIRGSMLLSELHAEASRKHLNAMRLWGVVVILNATSAIVTPSLFMCIMNCVGALAFAYGTYCEWELSKTSKSLSEKYKEIGR